MSKKVIVAGSRTITDEEVIRDTILNSPHTPEEGDELVTGGADGVDTIAKEQMQENSISYTEFEPDWDEHGKSAGPIRNYEMAQYADSLIAIWDGESNGTKDMIDKALQNKLDVYVKIIPQT